MKVPTQSNPKRRESILQARDSTEKKSAKVFKLVNIFLTVIIVRLNADCLATVRSGPNADSPADVRPKLAQRSLESLPRGSLRVPARRRLCSVGEPGAR